jgi:hypothetical protein
LLANVIGMSIWEDGVVKKGRGNRELYEGTVYTVF